MLQSELNFTPKAAVGAHAIVIIERRRRIQCPCCAESKTVENVYEMRDRLVTAITVRYRMGCYGTPTAVYEFHQLGGRFHEECVFATKAEAVKEIKRLRLKDKADMKRDLKLWQKRQKQKGIVEDDFE